MPIRYDDRTALLVVDVQNDFADPTGSLYVAGGEDVVGRVNAEIVRAREAGALVVFTQDWHPPSTPHFQKDGGVWPVHCVAGTWGAEFHPDLTLEVGAEVVRKGVGGEDGYSGFTVRQPTTDVEQDTGLEDLLRNQGVERVVIAGLATDYCVKETALDGINRGFSTTVITDAIRAVDLQPGDGDRALDELRGVGTDLV
ncbi:MAG: isochorismatase family protein [Acidimicrobiales bacterium]|nr:isochorismatase family protein [Actinomycetota bacterium]